MTTLEPPRGLSPTSRRSLGPSSRPSSKERESFMQSSRRTTCSFFSSPRGERAAFLTGVWAPWTTAHVFGSHFCTIVRPFHMVRRRLRFSSSRQVLARLNGPREHAFAVSGSPVHVCDNIKVSAARLKNIYHKALLEHNTHACTPLQLTHMIDLPLRRRGSMSGPPSSPWRCKQDRS